MAELLLGAAFVALGAGGWWFLWRRTGDALHPIGLLLLFWLSTFGFSHWNVAASYDEPYYADPFGVRAYLAVVGSLITFGIGFWLVDPGLRPLDRARLSTQLTVFLDGRPLKAITLVCYAVATMVTVYFVRLAGEIPLFSPRVDELRQVWKRPLWGYLYDLHMVVILVCAILVDLSRSRRGRLAWSALALTSVLQLAFGGVRSSPLTGIAWAAVYLFYRRSSAVRLRHLAAMAVIVLGVSSTIEYYRRTPLRLDPGLANPRLDLSPAATLWGHTAAGFKNLQLSLERDVPPLALGSTSYDLPKTFVPRWREQDEVLSNRYGVHNSATYLLTLWLDFGVFGLILMPGVYGAMTGLAYRRFRDSPNFVWLVVYIDFLLATVLAFRTHRFLGNSLLFFAVVAGFVHLFASRRGRPASTLADDGGDVPVGRSVPAPAPAA